MSLPGDFRADSQLPTPTDLGLIFFLLTRPVVVSCRSLARGRAWRQSHWPWVRRTKSTPPPIYSRSGRVGLLSSLALKLSNHVPSGPLKLKRLDHQDQSRLSLRSIIQVSQALRHTLWRQARNRWRKEEELVVDCVIRIFLLVCSMTSLIEEADVFVDENSSLQLELEVRSSRLSQKFCSEDKGSLPFQASFGILFDIDGVIARGLNPLPVALDMISLLKNKNGELKVPIAFVTNACNKSDQKAKQLSTWLKCEARHFYDSFLEMCM